MGDNIRPIKTNEDYRNALLRIEKIIDAEPGTDEGDELEVLSTLVSLYEDEHFPMDMPSPVAAIKFRMEQAGLTARDLAPLMGGKAKVSEVLSGKRTLTLQMIRALHEHLGIPAEVLLQTPGGSLPNDLKDTDWQRFPLTAMVKLGWIPNKRDLLSEAEEIMRELIACAGGEPALPRALYRKNDQARQNAKTDPYALRAWCYYVFATARATYLPAAYKSGTVDLEFLQKLAKLSWSQEGPKLAKEFLANHGIHLVYAPHLPRTYLDGAALMLFPEGTPVIGLTLRYDRVDNFWFCLFHELAHVGRHLDKAENTKDAAFFDDLSLRGVEGEVEDEKEREADEWAEEALIPNHVWSTSLICEKPTPSRVVELAHELQINPAIVAGRVRHTHHNYRLLSQFVGTGQVRCLFKPEPSHELVCSK